MLKFTLVLLLFATPSFGWDLSYRQPYVAENGGFEETWETTGGDNTWTTLPTGWDADYSGTNVIDGSYSLDIYPDSGGSVGSIVTDLGTDYDTYTVVAKLNMQTNGSNGSQIQIRLIDSSDNDICSLRMVYSTVPTPYRVYGYHSGDSSSVDDTSFTHSGTGTWYVKLRYEKGTGSNGAIQVWATTQDDYTTNGWSNSEGAATSTSTDTAAIRKIEIETTAVTLEVYADSIFGSENDDIDF